jgi:MFS family permease
MDTAGAMLGPLLAVAVLAVAPQSYDAVFVVSFCVALIGVAIIVLFVKNPVQEGGEVSGDHRDAAPASVSVTRIRALLRQKEFRVLIAVGSALSLVTVSDSLLYLALQQRMTFAVGVFPLLYVVTALSFMVLAIPMGRLADRIGHRRVFLLGYGLLFATYALLLSPIMNGVVVVLMLATLGAYYAATDGVLMALASRLLPADMLATGLALVTTGTGAARLLASTLYGVFWERSGADVTLIVFALALIAILCVVSRTILRTAVN